jgi:hypothetical protein
MSSSGPALPFHDLFPELQAHVRGYFNHLDRARMRLTCTTERAVLKEDVPHVFLNVFKANGWNTDTMENAICLLESEGMFEEMPIGTTMFFEARVPITLASPSNPIIEPIILIREKIVEHAAYDEQCRLMHSACGLSHSQCVGWWTQDNHEASSRRYALFNNGMPNKQYRPNIPLMRYLKTMSASWMITSTIYIKWKCPNCMRRYPTPDFKADRYIDDLTSLVIRPGGFNTEIIEVDCHSCRGGCGYSMRIPIIGSRWSGDIVSTITSIIARSAIASRL